MKDGTGPVDATATNRGVSPLWLPPRRCPPSPLGCGDWGLGRGGQRSRTPQDYHNVRIRSKQ
eukprot:15439095-Alexandrium_andersonii.AAC.1